MPNTDNNIFDPQPAASTPAPYGPFEPSTPVATGLFEEPTAHDHGHDAPQDADFEQRYQAALADELESDGDRRRRRRRSLGIALPSRGLARQLVVGAICLVAAFLVASIAISLFHGSHREAKSSPATPAPTTANVSPDAHRNAAKHHRAARPRVPRNHPAAAREHRGRHGALRVHPAAPRGTERRPPARRQAVASTSPAAPPAPSAVAAPAPAPQPVFVPPSYTPPVSVPAPQRPPNSEFGFER